MQLKVDIEKQLHNFTLRAAFTMQDEVFALLGASGFDKSMTLKCIAGMMAPDYVHIEPDGQVRYDSVQGISEQDLDNARSQAEAKQAEVDAAQEALNEAMNGPRSEDVRAAEAQLQALQEEQAREEYLLSQYELRAPMKGVIRSRLVEPGDMASPSTPVFNLSLLDKKWVRAYVKEDDLGRIYEGQSAKVYIDSQKEKPLTGQIGYIADTAEFTPKTVQTDELRTALVYEVRVYVDDDANVLRLGMPATVKIEL